MSAFRWGALLMAAVVPCRRCGNTDVADREFRMTGDIYTVRIRCCRSDHIFQITGLSLAQAIASGSLSAVRALMPDAINSIPWPGPEVP